MRSRTALSLVSAGALIVASVVAWAQQGSQTSATGPAATSAKTAGSAASTGNATEPSEPAATAPSGEASQQQGAGSAEAAEGAYTVRLQDLEEKVNELKERIFRTKARLNLLKETVLHGVIAGSRSVIRNKNEMGSTFQLVKLVYALDGAQIFSKSSDSGALDVKREFDVFNGTIVPGDHTLSVRMVFRGHGYGVFTYLQGYKFDVRASHTFTAAEGRENVITVVAYEKGNATTELQDRPAVKFETSLYDVGGKGASQ